MIHLVTFATDDYLRSAQLCEVSAKQHGVVGCTRYGNDNPPLERGAGFWKWKPACIYEEMKWMPNGRFLIYADAGIEFINNVSHIIDRMDQDIFLFGNMWRHVEWCKADTIHAILPNVGFEDLGRQCQASVIFTRVSEWSRVFISEWLKYCLQPHMIDDSPSVAPNYPTFAEHRHDQAILTCLAHKYQIPLHWWPAVYNRFTGPEFVYEKGEYVDTYPPLFHHHRKRNHEWSVAA